MDGRRASDRFRDLLGGDLHGLGRRQWWLEPSDSWGAEAKRKGSKALNS